MPVSSLPYGSTDGTHDRRQRIVLPGCQELVALLPPFMQYVDCRLLDRFLQEVEWRPRRRLNPGDEDPRIKYGAGNVDFPQRRAELILYLLRYKTILCLFEHQIIELRHPTKHINVELYICMAKCRMTPSGEWEVGPECGKRVHGGKTAYQSHVKKEHMGVRASCKSVLSITTELRRIEELNKGRG